MSLRMIQFSAGYESLSGLEDLLGKQAIGYWVEQIPPDLGLASILLPTERTEAVMDLIEDRFGGQPSFRLILLPVEATLPKVEEEPKDKAEPVETLEPAPDEGSQVAGGRISREELYEDISSGTRLTRIYLITVVLSTLVASIGLVRDDVAVIIGAMVIAPLLGPTVALALATTLGDTGLAHKAMRTLAAGVAVAGGLSVLVGLVMPIEEPSAQMMARTELGLTQIVLAAAAGSAGALAYTSGLPASLIGVMVAVALLPPLVASGILLGSGQFDLAVRAFATLLINISCVNLAGVITFIAQGIRPRTWWEEKRARRASRLAIVGWLVLLLVLTTLVVFLWAE